MRDTRTSDIGRRVRNAWWARLGLLCFMSWAGCGPGGGSEAPKTWVCQIPAGQEPDYTPEVGCLEDFLILASEPLDASIPGARSQKTVLDTFDGTLYFQNSQRYPIHWDFARAALSGGDRPLVPDLASFNQTEYYSPSRRFVLGAVSRYQGPGVWAYEIAPYDTADAAMIERAFEAITRHAYFGRELRFHPTSEAVARAARGLSTAVPVVTTDELFAGIDYQPLNLGTSLGRLRFFRAAELESNYLDFRDIVVLDEVPNDISVVMGIITAAFQTPLSHVNVLSQNRGTPNMALRGAMDDAALRALQGKWVRLTVGPFEYEIEEVTREEADAWWEEHKPAAVRVPNLDLSVSGLVDLAQVIDGSLGLAAALDKAIPAFGGKASHYAATCGIGPAVPTLRGFVIPVSHYWRFMQQNGFDVRVQQMIAEPDFQDDPAVRSRRLAELRADMEAAPVDPGFEAMLLEKLKREFPGQRMRFRSSTNAEDLDGFTGAGLYISWSGEIGNPDFPVLDAVRKVWASTFYLRAFEERTFRSIDHLRVGMAVLVHQSYPDEEASGVALTNNPYDLSGLSPAFYVNVQRGGASVVKPMPGLTTDQFIYQFSFPGQPIVFVAHSNLVPPGTTVLTARQTHELGVALDAIHNYFLPIYGKDPTKWYAMDVEFKFEGSLGESPRLVIKQARPHSGWGR